MRRPPDGPTIPPAPAPKLVESCWQLRGRQSGKLLECAIFQRDGTFELRAGYGGQELVRWQRVASVDAGRRTAAEWKTAVLDMGGFDEVEKTH